MKKYSEPLKQVSIAEITPGTDMSELFKIIEKYNFLRINLGVETPACADFHGTDTHRVLDELCDNRKKVGFRTELHLNGGNQFWFQFATCGEVLSKQRGPNRVVFNLDTIQAEQYRWILGRSSELFERKECYLLNSPQTNEELGRLVAEFSLLERGVKFLNYPSNFDGGFQVSMPLFGRSDDYDWCGRIGPDTAAPALDWIVARYGYGAARIMTRGGVLTDKKTDLAKVGDYLENVAAWNSRAKSKLGSVRE